MVKQKKINSNLVDGVTFVIIGIAIMIYSLNSHSNSINKVWSQSPYLFPLIISIIMCLLSASFIYQGLKEKNDEEKQSDGHKIKYNTKGVIIIFVMALVYYLLLDLVKIPMITITIASFALSISIFEIATISLLVALQIYLGVRKIPVITLVSIITTLLLSVIFRTLLRVLLP